MSRPAFPSHCAFCIRPTAGVEVALAGVACIICGDCAEAAVKEVRFLRADAVRLRAAQSSPTPPSAA